MQSHHLLAPLGFPVWRRYFYSVCFHHTWHWMPQKKTQKRCTRWFCLHKGDTRGVITAAVADIHAAKVKQDYNEQHTQTVAFVDALAEPSAEVKEFCIAQLRCFLASLQCRPGRLCTPCCHSSQIIVSSKMLLIKGLVWSHAWTTLKLKQNTNRWKNFLLCGPGWSQDFINFIHKRYILV